MRKLLTAICCAVLVAIPALGQTYDRTVMMDGTTFEVRQWDTIASSNARPSASTTYTNNGFTTVEEALDSLFYSAPSVNLSFAGVGGTSRENGDVITDVDLSWTINKSVITRDLTGATTASFGAGQNGTYTHTNALMSRTSSPKSYTLTVDDGSNTDADTVTFTFRDAQFWGLATNAASLSNSEIIALESSGGKELRSSGPSISDTLNPSVESYIWVCYPESWGADPNFTVAGLPVTGWVAETNDFVNAFSYTNSYLRYRSPNPYNLTITLTVSP